VAVLAQTCGIAAAKRCVMTPFKKVACQLNVTDDLANGVSLFKAEVLHAKKLNTMVKNLAKNEFAFIISDEAFRGTSATEGEAISCKFAQQIAANKNCLTITATHYHKMGELPEFGQKHVEVIIAPDGSYVRTFKFKDGMSTLNIAEKILQEENIFDS
jgi:DNA mismatch repair ATPase MutS